MKPAFTSDPAHVPCLVIFAAVARERSFTRAGAALRISTSAVSQRIRELEAKLGHVLFARSTRSVALSEAGERLYARVGPALGELDRAVADLEDRGGSPAGTLRITTSAIAAELVLHPALGEFHARFPHVVLDVTVDDGLSDLVRDGYEAGIRLGEALDRDVIAVPVSGEQRLAIVGSPDYFRAHGRPTTPRDLRAHAGIGYRYTSRGSVYRWELKERGRTVTFDVRGPLVATATRTVLEAARAGLGLAQTFEAAVAKDLAKGTLVRVLEAYCPPFPGFYLYYPSSSPPSRKLDALLSLLRKKPRLSAPARAVRK